MVLSRLFWIKAVRMGSLILLTASFAGCIRFQAETWHQGADDEAPKVHQVSLDTQQLVQGKQPPGDITV